MKLLITRDGPRTTPRYDTEHKGTNQADFLSLSTCEVRDSSTSVDCNVELLVSKTRFASVNMVRNPQQIDAMLNLRTIINVFDPSAIDHLLVEGALILVRVPNEAKLLVNAVGVTDGFVNGAKVIIAFGHQKPVIDVDTTTYVVDWFYDFVHTYCHDPR